MQFYLLYGSPIKNGVGQGLILSVHRLEHWIFRLVENDGYWGRQSEAAECNLFFFQRIHCKTEITMELIFQQQAMGGEN